MSLEASFVKRRLQPVQLRLQRGRQSASIPIRPRP